MPTLFKKQEFKNWAYDFLEVILIISQIITIITIATIKKPVHIPALKMPAIASQLLKKIAKESIKSKGLIFFILLILNLSVV